MAKRKTNDESGLLCDWIVKGMQEKKAEDITLINLKNIKTAVADYFVLCSGNSDTHADAISDSIEEQVHKASGTWPWHTEGKHNKEWILIDYVNVVVHVFKKDKRGFYDLEGLWGDAETLKILP